MITSPLKTDTTLNEMRASGRSSKATAVGSDLEIFISRQNIARYQKLANIATTVTERATLFRLLAEEEAKLRR